FLEDEIFVVAPLGSEVLQIKMRGKDPQQLVKIVNAVKDSYMKNVVNAERADLLQTQATLESRLKSLNDDLDRKRRDHATAETESGSGPAADVLITVLNQQLAVLNSQVAEKKARISDLDGRIAIAKMRADDEKPVPDYLIDKIMDQDPQVQDLKKALSEYKAALDRAIAAAKNPAHDPSVKSLQGQAAALQKQLDDMRTEMRPKIEEQFKRFGTGQNGGIEIGDLEELKVQRAALVDSLATVQQEHDKAEARFENLKKNNTVVKQLDYEIKEGETLRASWRTQLE